MKISEIFDRVASTSSSNEKKKILAEHAGNHVLVKVIEQALNPFVVFFIKKIPEYTKAVPANVLFAEDDDEVVSMSLMEALQELEALSSRRVTGHDAIAHLTRLLSSLDEDDAKVLIKVVSKDLRCGVSESTVNKVWPNLIPTYPCMLATQFDEKLAQSWEFPSYAQLKMDGMRFNAIVVNGKVEFRSRSGNYLDFLGQLEEEFVKSAYEGKNWVFDGELWVAGEDGLPLPRKIGNGILLKAQKGTLTMVEATKIRATLWDMIPYDDFVQEECKAPYALRFTHLDNCLFKDNQKLFRVPNHTVTSMAEVNNIFAQYLKSGQEGIILKSIQAPWVNKRPKFQMKFKAVYEADLLCTEWVEGTGKYAGKLGAIKLETSDGLIKTDCGSGFTDKDREMKPEDIVGKIVAINYNERIVDSKTGQESLFLPIYVEVRHDKTIANSSNELEGKKG